MEMNPSATTLPCRLLNNTLHHETNPAPPSQSKYSVLNSESSYKSVQNGELRLLISYVTPAFLDTSPVPRDYSNFSDK